VNKYWRQSRESRRRWKRWRGCERKVRYATRADALRANPGQDAYDCRECGGAHLTGALVGLARSLAKRPQKKGGNAT
jgi:hypothetical protein